MLDIIFDTWTAQVYKEVLGEALGAWVWKAAQQQQARKALEPTMTKTTPSEMAQPPPNEPATEGSNRQPPREVVVLTSDSQSELLRDLGLQEVICKHV